MARNGHSQHSYSRCGLTSETGQPSVQHQDGQTECEGFLANHRQDAFAKAHPLVVEQEKNDRERGFYLHPELYGAAAEKGISWARHPETMKRMKAIRERQKNAAAAQKPMVANAASSDRVAKIR